MGEEKNYISGGQFTCFTIFNWENWFLNFFSGNVTLRLHRCYLCRFNDGGTQIPLSRKEEAHVADAVTSKPLGTQRSLPFPGL